MRLFFNFVHCEFIEYFDLPNGRLMTLTIGDQMIVLLIWERLKKDRFRGPTLHAARSLQATKGASRRFQSLYLGSPRVWSMNQMPYFYVFFRIIIGRLRKKDKGVNKRASY